MNSIFQEIVSLQFDNREIATIIWLSLLIVATFLYPNTRKMLPALFRATVKWRILLSFFLLIAYVSLIIYALKYVGFWAASANLKDTIAWTMAVAFPLLFNLANATQDEFFFHKTIKALFALTLILEFIVGSYPFSLVVEFLLIPLATFLSAILVVSETKLEYRMVRNLTRGLLFLLGLAVLWHSASSFFANTDTFFTLHQLIVFLLPYILTILFIPFMYALALLSTYEFIFVRIRMQNRNSPLIGYAKRQLILQFGVDLKHLILWSKRNANLRFNDKREFFDLVNT